MVNTWVVFVYQNNKKIWFIKRIKYIYLSWKNQIHTHLIKMQWYATFKTDGTGGLWAGLASNFLKIAWKK